MIKVGAHRGASSRAPENTLTAMQLALEEGAELLEFDVQLTRDGVPVVIHDEWVDRTSSGHGLVKDFSWAELQGFDFGSYRGDKFRGTCLPSLDEVLELGSGHCEMNIEIKNGPVFYPGIEETVIKCVQAHDCMDEVIISSFDHRAIDICYRLDKGVRLAYLISHLPLNIAPFLPGYPIYALHPYYAYVTQQMVDECRQLELKINVWGTNDPGEWLKLAQWGVDGIITDYVAELRALNL